MKMEDIETKYQMSYPDLFRKIYLSHGMSLMCDHTVKNFANQFFPNEYVEPYPYWNMLHFSDIENWHDYLLKKISESGYTLKDKIRFLPFAMEDEGDFYLFDLTTSPESPILCCLKDLEIAIVHKNFEHFICSHLASCIVDLSMPLSHWLIRFHIRYLTEEHRKIFERGDLNAIEVLMQDTSCYIQTDYIIY